VDLGARVLRRGGRRVARGGGEGPVREVAAVFPTGWPPCSGPRSASVRNSARGCTSSSPRRSWPMLRRATCAGTTRCSWAGARRCVSCATPDRQFGGGGDRGARHRRVGKTELAVTYAHASAHTYQVDLAGRRRRETDILEALSAWRPLLNRSWGSPSATSTQRPPAVGRRVLCGSRRSPTKPPRRRAVPIPARVRRMSAVVGQRVRALVAGAAQLAVLPDRRGFI